MNNANIIGIFEDEQELFKAMDDLQANNIPIKDVYSPIPLHGVFERLKLTTRLPYATFIYGAVGTVVIFAFLYWTSVVSYPLKFGGKPLNTLSFIIIMFVLTIFVGTFFTFLTYFIREKMYPGKKVKLPVPETTNNQFAILIEKSAKMSKEDVENVNEILKNAGAIEIKESDISH